jgi:hypothetical protein
LLQLEFADEVKNFTGPEVSLAMWPAWLRAYIGEAMEMETGKCKRKKIEVCSKKTSAYGKR